MLQSPSLLSLIIQCPKIFDLNYDYYVLTKIHSKREITQIGNDIATDNFNEVYKWATDMPYCFLVIDRKTHDPERTCRANFVNAISSAGTGVSEPQINLFARNRCHIMAHHQ